MLKEFTLEGKTALITGGSAGIGKAIALVFAEAGADVVITARRVGLLEEAAEEIRGLGHKVVPIQADVSDPRQVDKMAAKAMQELGRIDILVNNAGGVGGVEGPIVPLPGPVDNPGFGYADPIDHRVAITEEGWRTILNLNVGSAFYCCRAIVPQMLERRQGKVINIASTNAVMAYPYISPYMSSKAGMKMLTKVMANEWGRYNVNVNVIGPGWFVTEKSKDSFESLRSSGWVQEQLASIPLRRLTDTRDLGLLALYLACPASDWMTGQFICLDGGETSLHD